MTYVSDSVVLTVEDLREIWPILVAEDRIAGFSALSRSDAEEFFLSLSAQDQATLVVGLPERERRLWMRLLAPDDAKDRKLAAALKPLISAIDVATMREANLRAAGGDVLPDAVAKWLWEEIQKK